MANQRIEQSRQPISIEYKILRGFNKAMFRTQYFENLAILHLPVFSYVLQQVSDVTFRRKNWIIFVTRIQISNVCNTVESHCRLAIIIVHHHANGRFD